MCAEVNLTVNRIYGISLMQDQKSYAGTFMIVFLFCAVFLTGTTVVAMRKNVDQPLFWNVIQGRWALSFERLFDKTLEIRETGTDFWGAVNYFVFGNGKPGVLIGEHGWLFTDEEFIQYPGAKKRLQEKVDFVKKVKEILEESNVKLLIALVPAKARVYAEKLGRYRYPDYKNSNYHTFRKEMQNAGIPVTDILWLMEEKKNDGFSLFLKTDTHWSPAGARMAARLVANEAGEAYPGLVPHKTNYVVEYGDVMPHRGDLLRYVPLGRWEQKSGIEPDYIKVLTIKTEESKDDAEKTQDEGADLFGDVEVPPVTLVGTSYSANPKWGFANFLMESMGTEILNAAEEGMGPFETMRKYLKDAAFKKTPPKLLVWEIPERYLPMSYDLKLEGEN